MGWPPRGTVSPGISRSWTVHLTPQRTRGPGTPRPSAPPGPLPAPPGEQIPHGLRPHFPSCFGLFSLLNQVEQPVGRAGTCAEPEGSFTRDVGWSGPRGPGEGEGGGQTAESQDEADRARRVPGSHLSALPARGTPHPSSGRRLRVPGGRVPSRRGWRHGGCCSPCSHPLPVPLCPQH